MKLENTGISNLQTQSLLFNYTSNVGLLCWDATSSKKFVMILFRTQVSELYRHKLSRQEKFLRTEN